MSGKMYADSSNQQVVDFKDLILQINFFIIQNASFGNQSAITGLVDQLETMMDPYVDKQYKEDLKDLNDVEVPAGTTPNEVKQIRASAAIKYVEEKHRALMRLAYRKRFLPSASLGAHDMNEGEGESLE